MWSDMQTTDIPWATYTWNPVVGCTHRGPECWNCWAETFARRQASREDAPDYLVDEPWSHDHAEEVVTLLPERLDEPLEYSYPEGPGTIFTVSMGDLFHRLVPDSHIRRVIAVARQCPRQMFIFLTKRAQRAAAFDVDWPDNVWLGTSVGSGPGGQYPDTTHRIEALRAAEGVTRWVSFEPLVEPIGPVELDHIDWAVVGGESGPEADRREMDHRWAADLLRQCREQDVRFFFKQSSARFPERGTELRRWSDDGLVEEQIREFPDLPDSVRRAREGVVA